VTEPSTQLTRLSEKASTDRADLDALLDAARICHVGLVADGHPLVIPTAIARDGERILVHGSTGAGWMRRLAAGADACVTVTALDGLVVARSAFESSMHYRSAVLFGTFSPVGAAEKLRALDRLTDALIAGRSAEVRRPTARELSATLVLTMPIQRWSVKLSAKWPEDPESDVAGDTWAGVVPMRVGYGPAENAPDLQPGIAVPASVSALVDTGP
jgi:nitroimidazol reductase NimA-like FMN-containing flavoprotein (pyridoxamine 5'-phosphate oxidase superfamily)